MGSGGDHRSAARHGPDDSGVDPGVDLLLDRETSSRLKSDPTASSRMTAKGDITQCNSTPIMCYQTNTDMPNEAPIL